MESFHALFYSTLLSWYSHLAPCCQKALQVLKVARWQVCQLLSGSDSVLQLPIHRCHMESIKQLRCCCCSHYEFLVRR